MFSKFSSRSFRAKQRLLTSLLNFVFDCAEHMDFQGYIQEIAQLIFSVGYDVVKNPVLPI